MRILLIVVGVVLLLAGALFMAQGSGAFPYPRTSFMIDQRPWVWRGLVLVAAGAVALAFGRRR